MNQRDRNRSAGKQLLLSIEHHAEPLKDLIFVVWTMALVEGWTLSSERGGINSWRLHKDEKTYPIRGRLNPPQIELAGHIFKSRTEIIRWFSKNS